MSTTTLNRQEAPGIAHDQTHTDLHQTHEPREISIQNLTHYPMNKKAAAQVSETKPILIDRSNIQLTETELCKILDQHICRSNLKTAWSIKNRIWRSKLKKEEIDKMMLNSLKNGGIMSSQLLAKLRQKPLSKKEKKVLVLGCINVGLLTPGALGEIYLHSILKMRLIPELTYTEKIALFNYCIKNRLVKEARIIIKRYPITFFLNKVLNIEINTQKEVSVVFN